MKVHKQEEHEIAGSLGRRCPMFYRQPTFTNFQPMLLDETTVIGADSVGLTNISGSVSQRY